MVDVIPDGVVPDTEEWTLRDNTQVFTSSLNGVNQTVALPGSRWQVSMTYNNRFDRDARELTAFLVKLRGRSGRFYMTPADWEPYGSPAGSPTVSGSQNVGAISITTTGWNTNITELFVAGDYFEVNGELKKITDTVGSDGSGNATLDFAPPLRNALSGGESIRYTEPRAQMLLRDDQQARWGLTAPQFYNFTIEAVEALDL